MSADAAGGMIRDAIVFIVSFMPVTSETERKNSWTFCNTFWENQLKALKGSFTIF